MAKLAKKFSILVYFVFPDPDQGSSPTNKVFLRALRVSLVNTKNETKPERQILPAERAGKRGQAAPARTGKGFGLQPGQAELCLEIPDCQRLGEDGEICAKRAENPIPLYSDPGWHQRKNPGHCRLYRAQAGVRYSIENPLAYIDTNSLNIFNNANYE
jgi:hypothetical protein